MHSDLGACFSQEGGTATDGSAQVLIQNNNNNEYLERLTRTGPKRLHVLYKYIFVKIQCVQHECTHTRMHTHRLADARTHTHTHKQTHTHQLHVRAIRAMRLKKRFLKRERTEEPCCVQELHLGHWSNIPLCLS